MPNNLSNNDRLTYIIYMLARDHLPFGQIVNIINVAKCLEQGNNVFTNKDLESFSRNMLARLEEADDDYDNFINDFSNHKLEYVICRDFPDDDWSWSFFVNNETPYTEFDEDNTPHFKLRLLVQEKLHKLGFSSNSENDWSNHQYDVPKCMEKLEVMGFKRIQNDWGMEEYVDEQIAV